MFTLAKKRSSRKARRVINIHQNTFKGGYQSTISNSRRSRDSLSDLLNMEIVQDGVPRPRPSTVEYGTQPSLPVVGRGSYKYNGSNVELFMLNDGGVGKVYKRIDGGSFTLISGKTYDITNWTQFCQSMKKVYPFNGVDNLSYIDLATDTIQTYSSLATPGAPTLTRTGMAGTNYTYYYKIAANNAVGTSTASTAATQAVSKLRESWISGTDYISLSWSSVAGATSYNIYVGTSSGNEKLVQTVVGTTWVDDGSLVADPFTLAPAGNSTAGFVPRHMYNDARNSQIIALDTANNMYYSAPGTGDFSPYDGGGYVPIDEFGNTTLNYVDGFRDGKGNPVITISAKGAAGKGKMFHATPDSLTYGDQVISFWNVYEANGQYAPYAPRAVVKIGDSLVYTTGNDIKSTGTSQNIVNILTTASVAQVLHQNDLPTINLSALDGAVGTEWDNKAFFAFPIGADYNNQIWYMDSARKNLWVLRWTFDGEIKDLWTYEDNSGISHFCILIDNSIREFTRNLFTQDSGTAFRTRCAFSSLVWDEDGLVLANIRTLYFKLLEAKGTQDVSVFGLDKDGVTNTIGSETFTQTVTFTGIGIWDYSGDYKYGDEVGTISTFAQSIGSQKVKTNAKMINQLDWEITTDTIGCDYLLSSVNTNGTTNDKRKLGD